jgi:hypothetical protein
MWTVVKYQKLKIILPNMANPNYIFRSGTSGPVNVSNGGLRYVAKIALKIQVVDLKFVIACIEKIG